VVAAGLVVAEVVVAGAVVAGLLVVVVAACPHEASKAADMIVPTAVSRIRFLFNTIFPSLYTLGYS
jgi:hypothetical protein